MPKLARKKRAKTVKVVEAVPTTPLHKLHPVFPPLGEQEIHGDEPTWYGITLTPEQYRHQIGRGFNWHSYCAVKRDYRFYVQEWIAANRKETVKADLSAWAAVPDKWINPTTAALARMHMRGFPLHPRDIDSIWIGIEGMLALGGGVKPKAERPSVQDHMRQQVSPILSDIDAAVDDAIDKKRVKYDELAAKILVKESRAPQLKVITEHVSHYIREWEEAVRVKTKPENDDDKAVAEGYGFITTVALQRIIDGFVTVRRALEIGIKADAPVRKPKPINRTKIVSKLKFKESLGGYSSIDPRDILGATTLWCFDTAKRKLIRYAGNLGVKGTTIIGFTEAEQKMLRRPKEQLAEFKKLKKGDVQKWFNKIRAKAQPASGRTNPEVLILRAD